MAALTAVFSRLLSMAVAALPVMALVLAVRAALGRAPARYRYGLWLAVGFRLACPVSVARLWSLFNLPGVRTVGEATGTVGSGAVRALVDTAPTVAAVPPAAMNGTAVVSEAAAPTLWEAALPWCAVLWVLGMLAVLTWGVVSAVRLRRTVREAVSEGGEVWTCGAVPTPFVLGLLRPRIYLPPHLDNTERTYVLAHERHHIRRCDPWWKLFGWCLLAVYWWDPAVWLCWVLFCRDMEMSCDEVVLELLGSEAKRGYSLSLVAHAAAAPMPAALAFGEHDAARRVKHVLSWKKATPRMAFLAAAAAVLAVTACLGNGMTGSSWVRLNAPGPMIEVSWDLKEPIRAWALYADTYAYGTRTESRLLTCGELTQQSERKFSGTLYWNVPLDEAGGFSNTLVGSFRGESWSLTLPQPHYTGVGSMTGQTRQRLSLDETGGATLVTIYLSDKEGGGTAVPASGDPILTSGGVRLRLATSQQGVDAFDGTDLAASLHALHTPALGDDDAAALLEALETDMLDRYTFARLSKERALVVEFESGPYDENALDASMLTRGALLMALADDLQEVRWSYPVWATGETAARNLPAGTQIGDYGTSPEQLAQLLTLLGSLYSQDEPAA